METLKHITSHEQRRSHREYKRKQLYHEQFIAGKNGKVQYVIVPADEYEILSDIIEDYGLGLAIKKAMKDKMYSKKEALKILGDA